MILAAKEVVLTFLGEVDEPAVLTKTNLILTTSFLRTLVALAALPESSPSSDSLVYSETSEFSLFQSF